MSEIESLIDKIKCLNKQNLTLYRLNEIGIDKEGIEQLLESNNLVKVDDDLYQVKLNSKNPARKKSYQLFLVFSRAVREDRYIKAYYAIKDNIKILHENELYNYDDNMYIILMLLKQILGEAFDFSAMETLQLHPDVENDSYHKNFVLFKRALNDGNYLEAQKHLREFSKAEEEAQGQVNNNTQTLEILVNKVISGLNEKYDNKNEQLKQIYREAMQKIDHTYYEQALELLKKCVSICEDKKYLGIIEVQKEVLEDIILAMKGQNVQTDKIVNYDDINDFEEKVIYAINHKDYRSANEFIKEIEEDTMVSHLKRVRNLLEILLNINKHNYTKNFEPDEEKSYDSYGLFSANFAAGNYEEAINHLEENIHYNPNKIQRTNNKRLLDMLKYLIKMQNEKVGFENLEIDYKNETDSRKFNVSLDNHDYATASKLIGKITLNNSGQSLNRYKKILHLMIDLNNKYGKDNNLSDKEEIKSKRIEVTDWLVKRYVVDKKYEELWSLLNEKLEKGEMLTRLEHFTFKLITIYTEAKNNKLVVRNCSYKSDEYNSLKRMYEAINYKDIDAALYYLKKAKGYARTLDELETFEQIMKDIIELQEQNVSKKTDTNLLADAIDNLEETFKTNKNGLNEAINKLYELLENIYEKNPNEYYYLLYNIVNCIDLANNNLIDSTYFEKLECEETKTSTRIMFYLNNGDYISAYELIKQVDFNNILSDMSLGDKFCLYKLLTILNDMLNKPFIKVENENDEIAQYNEDHIGNIKKLLKKRDFYGAYQYYLNNDVKEEYFKSLVGDLVILYLSALSEEQEAFCECENADEKNLQLKINNYLELVNASSIKDNEQVRKRIIELNEKIKTR